MADVDPATALLVALTDAATDMGVLGTLRGLWLALADAERAGVLGEQGRLLMNAVTLSGPLLQVRLAEATAETVGRVTR